MSDQWFYVQDAQQRGPVSAEELARVIQSRAAGADPLVWRSGMSEWIPFSRVNSTPVSASSQSQPAVHPISQPIMVGQPVGSGHTPPAPGEMLTYFTPAGESAYAKDAKAGMVLGIVSVSLIPFFCCSIFGIIAMIGSLVCGILAVKFGKKGAMSTQPSQATTGKVCGIIGIVASAIYIVMAIFALIMIVIAAQSMPPPTTVPTTNPTFLPAPTMPTSVPSN